MTRAVRVVVGAEAAVRREVLPRCGPSDERLDGQQLALVAEVPAGSVDLAEVADDLRRRGLDVEVGDGTAAPLLAVASGDGWTADLWPSTEGPWRLSASAVVDGTPDAAGRACG